MADMKRYRVKPDNAVFMGRDKEKPRRYAAGEQIELTDDEAKSMPWAIESVPEEARKSTPTEAEPKKK